MANEITIPLLPCVSINDTLAFYNALGFATTYQQAKPNLYTVVQREAIILHFFYLKGLDPAQSYSTCLVVVDDINALYASFAASMRQKFGKLLVAGIPRMTALRNQAGGGRGFNIIDPGGNWIRFAQRVEASTVDEHEQPAKQGATTKFARALRAAELLAESKGDYAAAAKMLDAALAQHDDVPDVQRVQALVMRSSWALNLGDHDRARQLLSEVRSLPLSAADRAAVREPLQTADDLRGLLTE